MPDTTIEPAGGSPYDRPVEPRVSRLEEQMSDLKPILSRIEAILPHLATSAQLAELRGDIDLKLARFAGEFDAKFERLSGDFNAKLESFSGNFNAKLESFSGGFNAKLEGFSGGFNAKLEGFSGDFNAKLERLTGRIEGLPTTWQMITAIIAGQVALAALLCAAMFGAARLFGHL